MRADWSAPSSLARSCFTSYPPIVSPPHRVTTACIDEALAEAHTHNERWWDAEVHYLRGEFLLMHGAEASDVEAALLRAVEIARSQQAKSLELRATMSLARFWIAQNRAADARRWLGDLYSWFTEGFETPDLQAARLLLEHL